MEDRKEQLVNEFNKESSTVFHDTSRTTEGFTTGQRLEVFERKQSPGPRPKTLEELLSTNKKHDFSYHLNDKVIKAGGKRYRKAMDCVVVAVHKDFLVVEYPTRGNQNLKTTISSKDLMTRDVAVKIIKGELKLNKEENGEES